MTREVTSGPVGGEKNNSSQPSGPTISFGGLSTSRPARARLVVFKFVLPIVCLGGLLAVLGILYRSYSTRMEQPTAVSAPAPQSPSYEQLKPQYMQMVTGGIQKLKGFSGTKYRGRADGVRAEITVFQAYSLLLNEMERYPLNESEKEIVRSLGRRVVSLQKREFPVMRSEWAKAIRNRYSRHRIIAWTSGDQGKILRVIAPPTVGKDVLNSLMEMVTEDATAQLRFAQINFTFTDERTVTANFSPIKKLAIPADGTLIYWQERSYQPVNWQE